MAIDEDYRAARSLVGRAHEVGVSGREPWRAVLRWGTRGRLGEERGWPKVTVLGTPWQDTKSPERRGWRQRAAFLGDDFAFAVDYQLCRRCQLGWVEQPYTLPQYERCGLASAGLAALRDEHPGLAWHTLGGHFSSSQPFWAAVGTGVRGGYHQRQLCPHVTTG